jgi:nicotinate-nucleotide pyrophosphorylase (carboxylating)
MGVSLASDRSHTNNRPDDHARCAAMLDPIRLQTMIDGFLEEDVGLFDLTSNLLVPAETRGRFDFAARESFVLAGIEPAMMALRRYTPDAAIEILARDGQIMARGDIICRVAGRARGILTAERTALNLMQHLSGIATLTRRYVDRITGTKAVLVDTRKTTPGLRMLEKYATHVGGARNHRLRLDGGILVKDNHIAMFGSLTAAIARAKSVVPLLTKVEVECDTLDQVREASAAGADILLLDNMPPEILREAIVIVAGRCPTEASGGVNLDTIRAIAETGVDFISVGRLTQGALAVDIGLDVHLETVQRG